MKIQLTSLNDIRFILLKPILVEITFVDKKVHWEIKELLIDGLCETKEDVLIEVELGVIEDYNALTPVPDEKLAGRPKKWKAFLLEHIRRR